MEASAKFSGEPAHLDLEGSPENEDACRDVLKKAVPSWRNVNPQDISLKTLVGGYTNKLFKATARSAEPSSVLLRFFGKQSDTFIDRAFEQKIVVELYKVGLAPPLYAEFANGLVYGYTEGRPLHENELESPKIQELVAAELAHWHNSAIVSLDIPREATFFDILRRWAALDSGHFALDLFGKITVNLQDIVNEINEAEQRVAVLRSPVVLSHNDLLPGNIIVDEQRGVAQFIDQEYARYNYRGFDIGNHFCEYLGFDNYDYDRFPSRAVQENFVRAYMRHAKLDTTQAAVDALLLESEAFALLANIHWGLWALYQSKVSDNRFSFDYLKYAKQRLLAYYDHKERVYAAIARKPSANL